ncbi:MAG: c-type cytochrome [Acidobacteria bacterium]|nr:c-type cytochrome [Acidobacteriota bacterium]
MRLSILSASCAALAFAETLPVPLGLDAYVPAPASNPMTREKVELGRALFFFRGLSRDGTLSCGGCHLPERAFTDGKPGAVGVRGQVSSRRTPPLLNRAWGKSFFWDGRAATLEAQVLQPILNPKEMDLTLEEIRQRVRAEETIHRRMKQVFGREAENEDIALALASYVRTILSGDSPYDRFVAGDRTALSPQQQLGLRLFRGKANCVACHVGPQFSDERFHNTGTAWRNGEFVDAGRAAVSQEQADRGAFRTPGLREVAGAAPYMHDGSLQTLEEVVDFYDEGGRENPERDAEMNELKLTMEEKRALVEFLKSLSGKVSEGWPEAR